MRERRKSPILPIVVAVIAAIVLVFVVVQGNGEDESADVAVSRAPTTESADPAEAAEQLARRDPDDPMALGDVDAPVVMIAYSEFQCPFCGKFARDTEPTLVEKYVDSGVLRIEWRDFPYLGTESMVAARGGRAAADQDRFWEFEEAMYADQLPPNSGELNADYLTSVAEDIGLDVDEFREHLSDVAASEALVQKDFAEGQAIGVTGTPAFVINGVPVIGAQPIEVFEQTIEQAAKDAGS